MSTPEAIQVSSLPMPPNQYVTLYTDENIRRGRAPRPPPPIHDIYMMFGNNFNVDDAIIRPLEAQGIKRLYPQHFDRRRELKKLNHSLLVNFLDLIDLLVQCPDSARRAEKVLHIDGGWARVPAKPEFNRGNVSFELQILLTTKLNVIGRHLPIEDGFDNYPLVEFMDVVHHESRSIINVKGYLKTCFDVHESKIQGHVTTFGCGSITNGSHKLEVRIVSFKNSLSIQKGDAVFVRGRIESQGGRLYLQCQTEDDIEFSEEPTMSLNQVIMGNRNLKRVAEEILENESRRVA